MTCQKKGLNDKYLINSEMVDMAQCGILWKSVECVEGSVELFYTSQSKIL